MVRCNVELSLLLEGAGIVVVGWVWSPESPRRIRLVDGNVRRELRSELVSVERPDVHDLYARGAASEEGPHSDRPGFLAFIATPNGSRPKLAIDGGAGSTDAVVVSLKPARFEGSLDRRAVDTLTHHRGELLELFRRLGLFHVPAVQTLLLATGLGPSELEAATSASRTSSPPSPPRTPVRVAEHARPFMFQAGSERVAAAIDHVFHVPRRGVFVVGWLLDPDERVQSVTVRCGTVESPDVLARATRHERPDIVRAYPSWSPSGVDRSGFLFLAELPSARYEELDTSLCLDFRLTSGEVRRLHPPSVRPCERNPLNSIRDLLSLVPTPDSTSLARHIGPAVRDLWATRAPRGAVHSTADVGEVPADPDVSVVVPIYGRYDFIEYQMSLFADDPDFQAAELIYVIDDPRIGDDALRFARQVYPLFRVPCRVVCCKSNNGFSAACNIGAALARGRLLLLLNSDVMPKHTGWLTELGRLYDGASDAGVVGAKLLYADGSIQHAGMVFHQFPERPGLWFNVHPGKGLPDDPEATSALTAVPAVTGACMLFDRRLYLDVGGLDEDYIVGDFEDSDICLRLRKRGKRSYCAHTVELFHLERQSQSLSGNAHWRECLTLYNGWRQTDRWDAVIRGIMRGGS